MGIMDSWKGGRIIYAYLIWVVFKATTAGGLYGEYIPGYLVPGFWYMVDVDACSIKKSPIVRIIFIKLM